MKDSVGPYNWNGNHAANCSVADDNNLWTRINWCWTTSHSGSVAVATAGALQPLLTCACGCHK